MQAGAFSLGWYVILIFRILSLEAVIYLEWSKGLDLTLKELIFFTLFHYYYYYAVEWHNSEQVFPFKLDLIS